MNKKLDEDIGIIRAKFFPMTLIGKEKTGGRPDAWEFTDYTNRDLDGQVKFAKKYVETQFYSKDEFIYVLEGLEKRAKEYFAKEFTEHISTYAKHDGRYYIDLKGDGKYVINEELNNEYRSIIVLKKEKLKLLYEKSIRELPEKYNEPLLKRPVEDINSAVDKLSVTPQTISDYLNGLPDGNQSELDMVNFIEKVLVALKSIN